MPSTAMAPAAPALVCRMAPWSCTSSWSASWLSGSAKRRPWSFHTGMQVNLGTISALVGRGDFVVLDKDDHASIVDGARLSWGEIKRFRHNDMADLERVLASLPDEAGKLVVVDGLFSMGGDIAPLPEIDPALQDVRRPPDGGRRPRHGRVRRRDAAPPLISA